MEPQDIGGGTMEVRPTITYPVSIGADGVSLSVSLSTNLTDWQPAAPHLTVVSSTNLGDGRALVTAFFNSPFAEGLRLFYKLVATGG